MGSDMVERVLCQKWANAPHRTAVRHPERLGDLRAAVDRRQPVVPGVSGLAADEYVKAELAARLAGGHPAAAPVHRADLVAPNVAAEPRAKRRPGRTVEPFGLDDLRRELACVADVCNEVPDLVGRR